MAHLLRSLFKIREGEERMVVAMLLFCFFSVGAFIIGRNAKDAIFLSSSAHLLPYMYMAVAVTVGSIAYAYSRMVTLFRLDRLITAVTAGLIVGLLLLRLLLWTGVPWASVVLYLYIEVMGSLLVVQFWAFANELFPVRQARRVIGIVGGGGIIANLISFPAVAFVRQLGVENLLFVAALMMACCLVIVRMLAGAYRENLNYARAMRRYQHGRQQDRVAARETVFHGHFRNIGLLSLAAVFAVTLIDYQFKTMASRTYPREELAVFLLNLSAWAGVAGIVLQFFITGRLLERFSVLVPLLLLPAVLATGSLGIALTGGMLAFTATRAGEMVLRYTLYDATVNLLYHPLPLALRRRAKAITDGVVRPVTQGIAGLVMLLIALVCGKPDETGLRYLSLLVIAVLAVWAFQAVRVRRSYLAGLYTARRDSLAASVGSVPAEFVRAALAGRDQEQIVGVIDFLIINRDATWLAGMDAVLARNGREVRLAVFRYLTAGGHRTFSRCLLPYLDDPDPGVQAAAIESYVALETSRAVRLIERHLDSGDHRVRAAAISGLIEHGGLDGMLKTAYRLKSLSASDDPRDRASAARIMGHIRIRSFHQNIGGLINDPELSVRLAAIEAAGRLQAPELVPALVWCLNDERTEPAAVGALIRHAGPVVPRLGPVLSAPATGVAIQRGIVKVLGSIPTEESMAAVVSALPALGDEARSQAIVSLLRIHQRNPDIEMPYQAIRGALESEIEHYFQTLCDYDSIVSGMGTAEFVGFMEERLDGSLSRAMKLLALLYPRKLIEEIEFACRSGNPMALSHGLNLMEHFLAKDLVRFLNPMLDNLPVREKLALIRPWLRLQQRPPERILLQLLAAGGRFDVAVALYVIGIGRLAGLREEACAFLAHRDPLVRESALFACVRLAGGTAELARRLAPLHRDPDPSVRRYTASIVRPASPASEASG